MMAYPLSRKRFTGRKSFMKLITITLMFSGGMIPSFLVVKELGMYNTIWAVILTGAISPWNLIISKTFLESIPDSFEESAIIDGCNDIQVLKDIFIPLSLPIIATMTLFYSVAHWNSFFTSLIYLNDKKKYPLQVFLRNILIESDMSKYAQRADDEIIVQQSIKYTVIVITSFPIVCLYPFLQKYFIKGVMIGGIKG